MNIDQDLDLYIKKKILLQNKDIPNIDLYKVAEFELYKLSFNKTTVEQIFNSIWNLFISRIVDSFELTDDKGVAGVFDFDKEAEKFIFDDLQRYSNSLELSPDNIKNKYSLQIYLTETEKETLNNNIKKKIQGFISGTDFPGEINSYYSYEKQKKLLLFYIGNLICKQEKPILSIRFNDIKYSAIDYLKLFLALELEEFIKIKELDNTKKNWAEEDNIYVKIIPDLDRIQRFLKITSEDLDLEHQKNYKNTNVEILKQTLLHVEQSGFLEEKDTSKLKTVTEEAIIKNKQFKCGNLEIDLEKGILKYKDQGAVDISPDKQEIKFLVLLLENTGRIVKYAEIAKIVKGSTVENNKNKDIHREIQFLKRDLGASLKEKGLPAKEIKAMIKSVKNTGYKIVCK